MAKPQFLLQRLLNAPDLLTIVPRLQPEVLYKVIQTCGLEDCAEFVALATPAQLGRILDLDVWRVRTPAADEEFDADRFGMWIAVLMECGAAVAAEKLAGLDIELVIAGFSRHAAVFDHAAVSSYTTLDGEQVPGRSPSRELMSEVGGYVIEARRTSAWEPIVDLLAFLNAEHREYFHRLMRGCVRLSNGPREEDGCDDLLDDDEQDMFDLACERDARREQQGYVTAAQARAFLQSGRDLQLDGDRPPPSAIARAYFRAMESPEDAETPSTDEQAALPSESTTDRPAQLEAAGVVDVLREAGVLTPQPRGLLGEADRQASRLSSIQAHVTSHAAALEELAYLANTVIAGTSIQGRPFTTREASDGAAAICNLGLENWPVRWSDPDLITAFQIGWGILHRGVCMQAAQGLIETLAAIRCSDRDIQLRLHGLRRELIRHMPSREPWRARNALGVIMMLDTRSWAALVALIDECPVIHAALSASPHAPRKINPSDFEFISENRQLAEVREFMTSLPSLLTR